MDPSLNHRGIFHKRKCFFSGSLLSFLKSDLIACEGKMTRGEERVTFGSSGDEPPLCPRRGTRVFSSLRFALPRSPLLAAPQLHADRPPSPANRGRCWVGGSWDAEQHPCTLQTYQGQSKPHILVEAAFSRIFSCACFRKQLSSDATYFPSISSQTWITTTDKTTHPKIQPLLSLPVLPGGCRRSPAGIGNAQPGPQPPILRSTHAGAGVVKRSLGGCIDLLLEKHESELGGQLE